MKVYLIHRSKGSWDDYANWVDTVILNPDKAKEYVDKFNIKLKRVQELAREVMPKDEDGELDMNHMNWMRYNNIFNLNEMWVEEMETID